jgi:DNA-binding protein
VLSPSINTGTFGEATVRQHVVVNINSGSNTDVILNENVPIPEGMMFVVPDGIILNVNNYALHNGGIIRKFGALNNTGNMTGNAPVGPIQADWVAPVASQGWTGNAITPAVTVKDGVNVLAEGVYYSAAYENNSNAGTGVVVITDLGDYHTVTTRTFTITGKPLPDNAIEAISAQTYTGSAILPAVVVKDGSQTLARDTDYIVSGANNINVGTGATVTVTGRGNYSGSISRTFTISPKALERSFIQSIAAQTYTGSAIIPAVVVKDSSRTLTPNTDYTVSVANNINVGTGAVVTVSGRGNYTGSATANFSIIARQLAADNIETIAAQLYTGNFVKPAVVVRDGSRILTEGTDYAVAYTDNVYVGTATVTVTGRGNYAGSAVKTFLIYTVPITGVWIEDIPAQTYTGDSIKPVLTVRDGNTILTAGVHYSVAYKNNVNAGTATATVTGVGGYTETMNKSFTIHPKPITAGWIDSIPAQTYTGYSLTPAVTVRDGNTILTAGVHYSATCINNVYAGTATVTVTGVGNYSGTASKSFTINPKPITGDWIESIPAQAYTGDSLKPALTVRDGNAILTAGVHYSATYNNNVKVGTATVTITGVGNYTGTASKSFLIEDHTPASVQIVAGWIAEIPAQTYTGDSLKPALTVIDGNSFLFAGVHYSAAYTNNVNAGTAIVIVTGTGNYSGSVYKYFAITPKAVVGDWIETIPNQAYTGSYIQPALTVRDGNNILTAGVHYSATYTNNLDVGTATVTIIGLGNYTGSASKNFVIGNGTSAPVSIAAGWIDDIPAQTYAGSAIQPAVTVRNGNTILIAGADYTTAYSANTNAGTATVIVTGVGNYTGTVYKYFTITPKAVAAGWLGNIPDQTWTGGAINPAVTVMDGSRTLTLGMDYIVNYSNNVNAGTATVTIVGTGNYTGTATGTFNIVRSRIPIQESWVQVIPDQYYTGYSIRPAVTVAGLTQGVDYTVSYYNNTAAGTAIAIVTGIGNYTGEVAQSFRIVDTGTEEATNTVLRIISTDNGISISGLTPGETFGIYTLQGQLLYESKATSPEETIYLREKGVYILRHKGKAYKFSW